MEEWSNTACLGYVKLACRNLKMSDEEIRKILDEVYYQFDMKTISEAKELYSSIKLTRE